MTTILIIEDELVLSETLSYHFERAGFTVVTASDGLTGLEKARQLEPSLIILDIMLPGLDGFSICRTLIRERAVPIVMLTALHDESHRIAGLELGAIDYVVKPFSMGELMARVRTILRWNERQRQVPSPELIEVGELRLNRSSRQVWLGDQEIDLSYKEFDLLVCLMHNSGVALSRDMLLERVWGREFLGSNRTIDVHIRWLRGIGYRFQAPAPGGRLRRAG
jgi:DNA-binding response OmpR family regulator